MLRDRHGATDEDEEFAVWMVEEKSLYERRL